MDSFDKALFIIIGVVIGAAVVYYIVRSRIPTAKYVVSPKTYSNLEEWEIEREANGRLKGIKVHRKAEEI